MRLSFTFTILGIFAGGHALANSVLGDYDLQARELEDLDARIFYDAYIDVDTRDLPYEDIDIDARELPHSWLLERDIFDDDFDEYVSRELDDEDSLYARFYDNELEERRSDEFDSDFMTREDSLESGLESRDPFLRYRIGVVIPKAHENLD